MLLAEAEGLAQSINLTVIHAEITSLGRRRPSTLFGVGTVERLGRIIRGGGNGGPEISVCVVDAGWPLDRHFRPFRSSRIEHVLDCEPVANRADHTPINAKVVCDVCRRFINRTNS